MKNNMSFILILFFIFLTASINAQNSFNFNYGFEKGKSYYYNITSSTTGIQTANGQEIEITADSKAKIKMEVMEFNNGVYTAAFNYDSFSSKTFAAGNLAETFGDKDVTGQKLEFTFESCGKKIGKKDAGVKTSLYIPINTSVIIEFPGRPIKTGEMWTVEDLDKSNPKSIVKSSIEYKIDGNELKNGIECIKISFNGKLVSEFSGESKGYEFIKESNSASNGVIYFDPSKKLIVEKEENIDIKGITTIKNMDISMPMTLKVKSNYRLAEK